MDNRCQSMLMRTTKHMTFIMAIIVVCTYNGVAGHGRLLKPPSRSSMWRAGYKNPPNYNDNQLYCGGVQIQYEVNGGRCGVCGDPFSGPRDNEPGGKYANGIIVKSYDPGEVIDVEVEITAPHKGNMEFRLCENDDPLRNINQTCLDKYLLTIEQTGLTQYPVTTSGLYQLKVILPEDVRCKDCVFQWRYNTGNSWGVDPITGKGCVGCGNQEQFYGCADIAIGYDDIKEGLSLITNEMKTGPPVILPGVPTPPIVTPDTDESGKTDNTDDGDKDSQDKTSESSYLAYRNFLDFQRQFPNEAIRPCVCHSCVGNTCVCECLSSFVSSVYLPNLTLLFLALASGLWSCLNCKLWN